jgi:DNA-binding response OmpR family regulator
VLKLLQKLKQQRIQEYELAILDLKLPHGNGIDLMILFFLLLS